MIAHHFYYHFTTLSAYLEADLIRDPLSWRAQFSFFCGSFGRIANSCFVLITSYYMCRSQITLKKFFKLYTTFVLCRAIALIARELTIGGVGFMTVASIFVPMYQLKCNFFGCFFIFYLTIPYLNILAANMTKRLHALLILLLTYVYVFCNNVPVFEGVWNYFGWFIYLYFIAAYLRFYPVAWLENTRVTGVLLLLALGAMALCIYGQAYWVVERLGRTPESTKEMIKFVRESNLIVPFLISGFSFMFFKNVKIPQSKTINALATASLGVFLLHTSAIMILVEMIWTKEVVINAFYSPYMPLYLICRST